MAIEAQLAWGEEAQDGRGIVRRNLRLEVQGSHPDRDSLEAVIHNISVAGILIQSSLELAAGDVVNIELPNAGAIPAEVVWADDGFFGCRFPQPISPSAISAALLRAPFHQPSAPPSASLGHLAGQQVEGCASLPFEEVQSDLLEPRVRAWAIVLAAVISWGIFGGIAAFVANMLV